MSPASYREVLVGVLALQLGFVRRDRLLEALDERRKTGAQALADVLKRRGDLNDGVAPLLRELVERHMALHEGSADKSLTTLGLTGALRDELRAIAGDDVVPTLTLDPNLCETQFVAEPSAPAAGAKGAQSRFRIVRPHAKGGLGQVSVALDQELNREVALKEIQDRFADDETSRARFVLEAEITGGLEHPGIVPVYGLGTDAQGRPYYAMRFIRGDSLAETIQQFHGNSEGGTRKAELKKEPTSNPSRSAFHLPTSEFSSVSFRKLLGRFVDICQAVEYAHSRGVLHRDLKPGNVMLGKYGETLVVDWGLAKPLARGGESNANDEPALRPSSADSSSTLMGSAVGTPAYMPPEQAAGKLDELGPASDVYSLGATLYHLLTGHAPFHSSPVGRGAGGEGPEQATRLDLHELLRRVQAGEFTRPRTIDAQIPKPLEAICLKAMATKAADRYASPAALADDVERYLADEPVAAHAEPFSLRARRWVRKRPRLVAGVAATVVVGLASLAAVLGIVSLKNGQLAQANDDLRAANAAERDAKNEAVAKQKESEAVFGFFEKYVLAAARPEGQSGGLGVEATIRDAIDAAEPWIAESFADQPLVEASIRHALGVTYFYLGEPELDIRQQERAREIRESKLGPDHPDTLQSMNGLATAYHSAGRLELALSLYEETLKRRTATLGPTHLDTLKTMSNRAALHSSAGKPDLALDLYDETLTLMREHLEADDSHTMLAMHNLGQAYSDLGKHERALPLLEETIKLQTAKLGPDHPDTLYSMGTLAAAYQSAGKPDLALPLWEKAIEGLKVKLRPEHPQTMQWMEHLANAYSTAQQFEESAATLREMLFILRARRPDDVKTFVTAVKLGEALARQRQYAEAELLYLEGHRELMARRDALSPAERQWVRIAVDRLVTLYEVWEKPAEAERWRKELMALAPTTEPVDAP